MASNKKFYGFDDIELINYIKLQNYECYENKEINNMSDEILEEAKTWLVEEYNKTIEIIKRTNNIRNKIFKDIIKVQTKLDSK